jgi:hypothetical protein
MMYVPDERSASVVSFAEVGGDLPISPRVQRTRHLTNALEREFGFRVERVPAQPLKGRSNAVLRHRVSRKALRPLVMDSFEIPARLSLRGWKPAASGALLIAWPFPPIYVAASHLVAAGIPYVVDVGDPWWLTEPRPYPWWRQVSVRRAQAAERFLWGHAAGGVVTTGSQADSLQALFPDLSLLVRPNGYTPAPEPVIDVEPRTAVPGELRLVQFGSVSDIKLSIGEWLSTLRNVAELTRVRFVNYGSVARPDLVESRDPRVTVDLRDPVDWGRACQIARSFDAAVVVANSNPATLPSKAVQYLTLPIPRIALTANRNRGELAAFAAEQPGFIAAGLGSPDDIPQLIAHLHRPWSDDELSPPAGDSWAEVARKVVRFAVQSWDRAREPRPHGRAEQVAAA